MDAATLLIACAWKAAILVALAAAMLRLWPRSSAVERRAAWAVVFAALPALPGDLRADFARIRVGGNVQKMKIIKLVPPKYPADAKAEKVQGIVRLKVRINQEGFAVETEIEESPDDRLSASAPLTRTTPFPAAKPRQTALNCDRSGA